TCRSRYGSRSSAVVAYHQPPFFFFNTIVAPEPGTSCRRAKRNSRLTRNEALSLDPPHGVAAGPGAAVGMAGALRSATRSSRPARAGQRSRLLRRTLGILDTGSGPMGGKKRTFKDDPSGLDALFSASPPDARRPFR